MRQKGRIEFENGSSIYVAPVVGPIRGGVTWLADDFHYEPLAMPPPAPKKRSTSKSTWTRFEREIAAAWGTRRTPLSGENSGHGGGDIILTGLDALVEAKLRARFQHHSMFRAAQADAKKHGVTPRNVFLYTRKKAEHGALVTMDASLFHELLAALKPLLRRDKIEGAP